MQRFINPVLPIVAAPFIILILALLSPVQKSVANVLQHDTVAISRDTITEILQTMDIKTDTIAYEDETHATLFIDWQFNEPADAVFLFSHAEGKLYAFAINSRDYINKENKWFPQYNCTNLLDESKVQFTVFNDCIVEWQNHGTIAAERFVYNIASKK